MLYFRGAPGFGRIGRPSWFAPWRRSSRLAEGASDSNRVVVNERAPNNTADLDRTLPWAFCPTADVLNGSYESIVLKNPGLEALWVS
jgi:hypothetical protein